METLLLLSKDTPEELIEQKYSAHWALKPSRAINCEYAVVCDMPNGNGVFVGRVRGIMRSDDPNRYEVHFSETATINVENVWNRASRNPVGYIDSSQVPIDFSSLDFRPV